MLDLSERLQSPLNVGTTLTALQVKGDTVRFAHVGDSALFRFQDGWCDKLTRDHTVAEEHQGGWTPYRPSEMKNVLTRCIGAPGPVEVDTGTAALSKGMWLLLCTDGLFRGVAPDEVRDWFKPDADAERICEKLVTLVNSRGGPDNSTVITIRCDG